MVKQSKYGKMSIELLTGTNFAKDLDTYYNFGIAAGLQIIIDTFKAIKDTDTTFNAEEIEYVINEIAKSNENIKPMFLKLKEEE